MCSACGYPAAPGHWTEAGAANMADRLRARFRRLQILKSVLGAYGLKAHDDGLVPGIAISDQMGNHTLAPDLAAVWQAAEKLKGSAIDPLDIRFTGVGKVD
jgi:hypothetical protein